MTQNPSGPKGDPLSYGVMSSGMSVQRRTIDDKPKEGDKVRGMYIKNENNELWNGYQFSTIVGKWWKPGDEDARENLKKAKEKDDTATLARTY